MDIRSAGFLSALLRSIIYGILVLLGFCRVATSMETVDVRGMVVNQITGEPIARALVYGADVATFTDPSGEFAIQVPTSLVELRVKRPGFAPSGRHVFNLALLQSGSVPLRINLMPTGVITGHVSLPDGEPAVGFRFTVFHEIGVHTWRPVRRVTTGSDGIFRIWELEAPGAYTVCRMSASGLTGSMTAALGDQGISPLCYPRAGADPSSISSTTIGPGQHLDLDLSLALEAFYKVTIPLKSAKRKDRATIHISTTDGRRLAVPIGWDSNRREYTFRLPAGRYLVEARRGGGETTYGRIECDIDAGSTICPQLTLAPLTTVTATVRSDFVAGQDQSSRTADRADSQNSHPGFLMTLTRDSMPFADYGITRRFHTAQNDGTANLYVIDKIEPGSYILRARSQNEYVAAATVDGEDISDRGFQVSVGDSPVAVDLVTRSDGGVLDIKISDNRGARIAAPERIEFKSVQVLAIPQFPSLAGASVATGDSSADIVLRNLPPGEYRVILVENGEEIGADDLDEKVLLEAGATAGTVNASTTSFVKLMYNTEKVETQ